MQKAHDASKNDYWRNRPLMTSPINQDNLNRIEVSTDVIDDRVIVLDATKAEQSNLLLAVKTVTFTKSTGTFTFTHFNGVETVINTDLEKLAVNFDYDDNPASPHYQQLIIELDDGTIKYIDLSALITQYEFTDSARIHFSVNSDGDITADIIDGSITANKLQPNFLADCLAAKNAAETAATNADESAEDSEAWAVGKRDGQDVPSTDPAYHNNAKYWAEQAGAAVSGGHTIINPSGSSMTQRHNLQFKGSGVTVTDNDTDDITEVTISGGGHTIQNPSGTDMTQREKMQFTGGVTVTDDDTNGKTIVNVSGGSTTTFAIAASAWVANSGADATDFPYIAEITTALYTNTFQPSEVLLLGATAGDYPTTTESEELELIDMYVKFTGSVIRLRATSQPTSAFTLVIKS